MKNVLFILLFSIVLFGCHSQKVHQNRSNPASMHKTKPNPAFSHRSPDEIREVFQTNKGRIFSIYHSFLQKDPNLTGKVIIQLTILSDGTVEKTKVVSTSIKNSDFLDSLIALISKFKFRKEEQVPKLTVTYPIEFLHS